MTRVLLMIPSCLKMLSWQMSGTLWLLNDAAKDLWLLMILSEDKADRRRVNKKFNSASLVFMLTEFEHRPPLVKNKSNKKKKNLLFYTMHLTLSADLQTFCLLHLKKKH